MKIAVLTYNVPHRKTYDTLCLLRGKGYDNITVFGQPMKYVKKRMPRVAHRPDFTFNILSTSILCSNLGYYYVEGEFTDTVSEAWKDAIFLLCGAGILSETFVSSHCIINAHPGYIPLARGLDAYKWSVYYGLPIGVTTHFLGKYVDAGEIIERRRIRIQEFDTFHSVAQSVYENEIDMLTGAIEKINERHEFIIPKGEVFRRMPEEKEREIFRKFEEYKENSIKWN